MTKCRPMTLAELARRAGVHVPTVQAAWSRQKKGGTTPVVIPAPTWPKDVAGADLWDFTDPKVKAWVRAMQKRSSDG